MPAKFFWVSFSFAESRRREAGSCEKTKEERRMKKYVEMIFFKLFQKIFQRSVVYLFCFFHLEKGFFVNGHFIAHDGTERREIHIQFHKLMQEFIFILRFYCYY